MKYKYLLKKSNCMSAINNQRGSLNTIVKLNFKFHIHFKCKHISLSCLILNSN